MPELPEVQTTVKGLKRTIVDKTIVDVWTDWRRTFREGSFASFKRGVTKRKVLSVDRRGKNILINLDNNHTIIIHMKMTGHLLFGQYKKVKGHMSQPKAGPPSAEKVNGWSWVPVEPGPLNDPFNRFLHVVFTVRDDKKKDAHLVFSDMRKFARISMHLTEKLDKTKELRDLGPEILKVSAKAFAERIRKKPTGKIKTVLMDQSVVAGIGNIYSDEMLWSTSINPSTQVQSISDTTLEKLLENGKEVLREGIDFGGDSMSDYRDIDGKPGKFQGRHKAYRKTGKPCSKQGCSGTIVREVIATRSAHYCDTHQKID